MRPHGWCGMKIDEFYRGKKVFVTGHTGFKGTWLCKLLLYMGATVLGYAKEPKPEQVLFKLSGVSEKMKSVYGDIQNLQYLEEIMSEFQPEIVFHLAAQPIVRESYHIPVETYGINVMGTVNVLESIRNCNGVKSVVNVTTDKVYENKETNRAYLETDVLNGYDPYSNSKSCSELVTDSYKKSFLNNQGVAVSTCRAGNVIGGGDFAKDRIIPDCFRAVKSGKEIVLRNPYSVRPYQHVLDPLWAYLLVAKLQYENRNRYEGAYNIGPDRKDNVTTGELADLFCKAWGKDATWKVQESMDNVHEAKLLYLDCSKIKQKLGWRPVWNISRAVENTVKWYIAYVAGTDIAACMDKQIQEFCEGVNDEVY